MSIAPRPNQILFDFKSSVGWNISNASESPTLRPLRTAMTSDFTPESSPSPSRFKSIWTDDVLFLGPSVASSNYHPIAELIASSEEVVTSSSESSSSSSGEVAVCRHYLKGRCRHKKRCKFSHDVKVCPHCASTLPDTDPAKTNHLTKCWKLRQEAGDETSD
jgi:hypothetical protein